MRSSKDCEFRTLKRGFFSFPKQSEPRNWRLAGCGWCRRYLMAEKKPISPSEFHERMKALRKQRPRPEFVEKFNKIMEEDEKHEREEKKKN